MPTYRLYLEDGSDAGEYRTAGYGFDVGDVIHLGPDRPGWRILEMRRCGTTRPTPGCSWSSRRSRPSCPVA
jgi:hypothetical protein